MNRLPSKGESCSLDYLSMRRMEYAHKVSGAKHGAKRTTESSDPV
ncbi:MAG TPA: hypothetical protein PK006_01330 [Saprospiraceae bacterium]|nr:hypothetical protein [Saprospiraceae bacterium]